MEKMIGNSTYQILCAGGHYCIYENYQKQSGGYINAYSPHTADKALIDRVFAKITNEQAIINITTLEEFLENE